MKIKKKTSSSTPILAPLARSAGKVNDLTSKGVFFGKEHCWHFRNIGKHDETSSASDFTLFKSLGTTNLESWSLAASSRK